MRGVLDLDFLRDGAPVAKGDLRRTFAALGDAVEHGGFWNADVPGAVVRPVGVRLAETVSVKDFGALGDGAIRPAYSHPTLKNATTKEALAALGYVQTIFNEQVDEQDTRDWVAFDLAIRYLASVGGGTLTVPAGHYVFRRNLVMRDNVTILGAGRETVILENAWQPPATGHVYLRESRTMMFMAGISHPSMITPTIIGKQARAEEYNLSGVIERGTSHVVLSDPSKASRFKPGEIHLVADVVRGNTVKYAESEPRYGQFNRISVVDGDGTIVFERPWRQRIQKARIVRLGTGRDGMYSFKTTQPWMAVQNIGASRFTGISRYGAMMQRSCIYGGVFEDFDWTGEEAIGTNALNYCRFARATIRSRKRGLELKFHSGASEFEDLTVLYTGTDQYRDELFPFVGIGQGSDNLVLRRCTITDGGTVPWRTARIDISGYEIHVEDSTITARRGGDVVMRVTSMLDGTRMTGRNITLVTPKTGPLPDRFMRISNGTGADAPFEGTPPLVQIDGLRCIGAVTYATKPVHVSHARVGSWIKNLDAPGGYTLGGEGAKYVSLAAAILNVPRMLVRDVAEAVNADVKQVGQRVLLETGELIHAASSDPFAPWMLTDEVVALRPGRPLPSADYRWVPLPDEPGSFALAARGVRALPGWPAYVVAADSRLLREIRTAPLEPLEWRYAPVPGLAGPTLVVRLADDADPGAMAEGWLRLGPPTEPA